MERILMDVQEKIAIFIYEENGRIGQKRRR